MPTPFPPMAQPPHPLLTPPGAPPVFYPVKTEVHSAFGSPNSANNNNNDPKTEEIDVVSEPEDLSAKRTEVKVESSPEEGHMAQSSDAGATNKSAPSSPHLNRGE